LFGENNCVVVGYVFWFEKTLIGANVSWIPPLFQTWLFCLFVFGDVVVMADQVNIDSLSCARA